MKQIIKAGTFKAECLKLMDQVKKTRNSIIITKHNKPIAKLVPFEEKKATIFGKMKGSAHIKGDIIQPIDEDWDANS